MDKRNGQICISYKTELGKGLKHLLVVHIGVYKRLIPEKLRSLHFNYLTPLSPSSLLNYFFTKL